MSVESGASPASTARPGTQFYTEDSGLTLRDLLLLFWRSRWLIASVTALSTAAALVAVWLWPRQFEANIVLYPVSNQSSPSGLGAIGAAMSQLGGIASLAGLNLTDAGEGRAEAIATLQSEALTQRFISDAELLPVLFSSKWDPERQTWKTTDPDDVPTLWKANQHFARKVRKVAESPKTGLVTMTITWRDPKLAAAWANDLVKLTNDYLRNKAISEATRNISYLNEQASKTNLVEVRQAIYKLMEAEIKKEMVARGSVEYALKIIDPAIAPEKAAYPRPLLWPVGGVIFGLVLGVLAAVIRHWLAVPGVRD